MKIPIKEAIDAGSWFDCCFTKPINEEEISFRFRILSFEKRAYTRIATVKLDVVNLCKTPLSIYDFIDRFFLFDQNGYEFSHHSVSFEFKIMTLNPKVKYNGSIEFRVPGEETEYYVSVKGANVKEV